MQRSCSRLFGLSLRFVTVFILLLLVPPIASGAATDQQKFLNKVERSTSEVLDSTPLVACVCQSPSSVPGLAGHLVSDVVSLTTFGATSVRVLCAVLLFSPFTGELDPTLRVSCADFVLLPK